MLFISVLFGLGALVAEKTNLQDWWQPITITGTSLGVEDFIIGFAIGGVAAVLYEDVYHRRFAKGRKKMPPTNPGSFLFFLPALYATLFFVFQINSFYSAVAAYSICTSYMITTRKELVNDSILSGLFMLFVGTVIYFLLFLIRPTFVQDFWYLPDQWYASLILGIPVGEYIWFFLTGAYIGPLYEYVKKLRQVQMK